MSARPLRAHARIPFGARVELWKYRTPSPVRAGDLSAGGIFLKTRDEIAEGSYLTLRIPLPTGRPFTALCKVVRQQVGRGAVSHRGLALSFVDIAPRDRERIDAYVRERSALSQPPAVVH